MENASLDTLKALSAAEVCATCEFELDVQATIEAGADVGSLLAHMLEHDAVRDGVQLLAHALQPRDAVWWAWDVALSSSEDSLGSADALQATSAWLTDPSDSLRRAASVAAEVCGVDSPAGCAAFAAFLSEGSLGPEDLEQEVPAPAGACAKAVTGVILMTAAQDPAQADARARASLDRWFELAETTRPWALADGAAPAAEGDLDDSGYDTNLKF